MSSPYLKHLSLLTLLNEQEKEEFCTTFFDGLVKRGLGHNLPRFWIETHSQFGGITQPSFSVWFFTMISLQGREFLRTLWNHLAFVKRDFCVLYEYIEESKFYTPCFA